MYTHSSLSLNQDKRRRFDSYPGSIAAGQADFDAGATVCQIANCAQSGAQSAQAVSLAVELAPSVMSAHEAPSLAAIAARLPVASWCAVEVPAEVPLPEREGEQVWRPGYGWYVPVQVPDEAPEVVAWPETGVAA